MSEYLRKDVIMKVDKPYFFEYDVKKSKYSFKGMANLASKLEKKFPDLKVTGASYNESKELLLLTAYVTGGNPLPLIAIGLVAAGIVTILAIFGMPAVFRGVKEAAIPLMGGMVMMVILAIIGLIVFMQVWKKIAT